MSNMSYCRFQNTSKDFLDCVDALNEVWDEAELSTEEFEAARTIREKCDEYIEEFDKLIVEDKQL